MSWQLVHPFHIGFLPPDIWYTLTFGTPWQLVHPDIWYTLTTGTPWQLVHPDIWYTLTFGTPRHLVHPDIWYTLTTCIVLFIVNLFIGLITRFPYLYVGEVLSGRGGGVLRGLCAQSHGFGSPQMTTKTVKRSPYVSSFLPSFWYGKVCKSCKKCSSAVSV